MKVTNKYKFFKGNLGEFKAWLNGLKTNNQAKYLEAYKSLIWIHPDFDTDKDVPSHSGWIFANGSYFSAQSISDIMTIEDGHVYLNGKDVEGDDKKYKILNASDADNATEEDSGLVTYEYLQRSRQFETLNN